MFTAALFTKAKIQKQPKCPLNIQMQEWGRRDIYAAEYYTAMKKNEVLSWATTWTDPEGTARSEISQRQIDDFTYMWNLKHTHTHKWINNRKQKQTHKYREPPDGGLWGWEGREDGPKWVMGRGRYGLTVTEWRGHRDERYNTGVRQRSRNSLCGDRWQLHCGEHSVTYKLV